MLPPDKQDKAEVKGKGGSGAKDFLIFVLIVAALALGATTALFYYTKPDTVEIPVEVTSKEAVRVERIKTIPEVERVVTREVQVPVTVVVKANRHHTIILHQTVEVPVEVTRVVTEYVDVFRDCTNWEKDLIGFQSARRVQYSTYAIIPGTTERCMPAGTYTLENVGCERGYDGTFRIRYAGSDFRKHIKLREGNGHIEFKVVDEPIPFYFNVIDLGTRLKVGDEIPAYHVVLWTDEHCRFNLIRVGD